MTRAGVARGYGMRTLSSSCYRPGLQGIGPVSRSVWLLSTRALELVVLSGVWSLQQLLWWLFTARFPTANTAVSAPGCNLGFFSYLLTASANVPLLSMSSAEMPAFVLSAQTSTTVMI